MGNTPSCVPLGLGPGPGSSSASVAAAAGGGGRCKVTHADGTVTRLGRPVRASELMLEHPGQFVCDACRLAVGCRVPGVAGDEVLEPRRAYFLLPMDMLYSVLTDEEMAALSGGGGGGPRAAATARSSWRRIAAAARRSSARRSGTSGRPRDSGSGVDGRVFPVLGLHLDADHGGDGRAGARAGAGAKPRAGGGLRRPRSWRWRPALDTIEEAQ